MQTRLGAGSLVASLRRAGRRIHESDPPGRRMHPSCGPGRPTPCPMSRHEFRATGRRLARAARFRRRPNWPPPWGHALPRSAMSGWPATGAARTPPSHGHRQLEAHRSSFSTNAIIAAPRSFHQPSGRVPITFMPSTIQRTPHRTASRWQKRDRPGPGMRLGGNCDPRTGPIGIRETSGNVSETILCDLRGWLMRLINLVAQRWVNSRSANTSGCSRCMKCPPGTSSTMYSFSNIRAAPR